MNSKLKKLFKFLQTDAKSILFTEEKVNNKLLKKLNRSEYEKDKRFANLFNKNTEDFVEEKAFVPIKATFVEKKDDIDRSTLYSFNAPFQLLHADVGNLDFLGRSAADPRYCLLFVDLFTSKVYIYLMKMRKSILQKMEAFHKEVEN